MLAPVEPEQSVAGIRAILDTTEPLTGSSHPVAREYPAGGVFCLVLTCDCALFASNGNGDVSTMGAFAMFPQKDSLPGAQIAAAFLDRNGE